MFQTISFTFLCACAVMSWSLLCYLDAIDEKKNSIQDYKVELYTEHSKSKDDSKDCQHKSTENTLDARTYNMMFNYGLVFLTTVLLSTMLQWLELTVRNYLQTKRNKLTFKKSFPFIKIIPNEPESAAKVEEKPPKGARENFELKEQLTDLQRRVRELLKELHAVNSDSMATDLTCISSNSSSSGSECGSFQSYDEMPGNVLTKSSGLSIAQPNEQQSTTSPTQNVFITHNHFSVNFNGSVNLLDQYANVGSLCLKNIRRRSEFLQVYGKFINGPVERPMLTGINNILM